MNTTVDTGIYAVSKLHLPIKKFGKRILFGFGVLPTFLITFLGSCNLQVANSCYQFFVFLLSFATLFLSGLLAAHVIKNSSYATLTATETNKKTGDKTRAKTRRAGEKLNELQTFYSKTNWKTIKVYQLSKAP